MISLSSDNFVSVDTEISLKELIQVGLIIMTIPEKLAVVMYIDGFSKGETAEILGFHRATVSSHTKSALAKARTVFLENLEV